MRFISFQSKEVVEILLSKGSYEADVTKAREKNDYGEDIEQLGGKNPIWLFKLPAKERLTSGIFWEQCRCEMSLENEEGEGIDAFTMLELELPEKVVKPGITHNACSFAFVTGMLTIEDLVAIHHVENTGHYYYKRIVCDASYHESMITDGVLDTRIENFGETFDEDGSHSCAYCIAHTDHMEKGLPICSSYCLSEIEKLIEESGLEPDEETFQALTDGDINFALKFHDPNVKEMIASFHGKVAVKNKA